MKNPKAKTTGMVRTPEDFFSLGNLEVDVGVFERIRQFGVCSHLCSLP
jgi:hypothetical protein